MRDGTRTRDLGGPAVAASAAARGGRTPVWGPAACFYVVTMLAAGALGLLQPWTGLDPQILELTQFGPAVAVLVVLTALPAVRSLVAATFTGRARSAAAQVALVSLTAAAVFTGCIGAYGVLGRDLPVLFPSSLVAPVLLVVPAQLVGACGEEVGWRCLLQPLLRRRLPTLGASAVVGLLWGVWHVQVFTLGAGFACAFLVATVAMSVVLGVSVQRSGGWNLAASAVFHLLINLGLLFFLDEEDGDTAALWTFALMCSLAAAAWAIADRSMPGPGAVPRDVAGSRA